MPRARGIPPSYAAGSVGLRRAAGHLRGRTARRRRRTGGTDRRDHGGTRTVHGVRVRAFLGALPQQVVPVLLPEAPAIAGLKFPRSAGDLDDVAALAEVEEPDGVFRAQIDAAVAHVGVALVPDRPRRTVLVLPAVGDAHRPVHVLPVVVGATGTAARRGGVHDGQVLLVHGQVDAVGGGVLAQATSAHAERHPPDDLAVLPDDLGVAGRTGGGGWRVAGLEGQVGVLGAVRAPGGPRTAPVP